MEWGRMDDWLFEKGGRKGYITERNGRSSWEQQGIIRHILDMPLELMNDGLKDVRGEIFQM
jgi:hypothetical protein